MKFIARILLVTLVLSSGRLQAETIDKVITGGGVALVIAGELMRRYANSQITPLASASLEIEEAQSEPEETPVVQTDEQNALQQADVVIERSQSFWENVWTAAVAAQVVGAGSAMYGGWRWHTSPLYWPRKVLRPLGKKQELQVVDLVRKLALYYEEKTKKLPNQTVCDNRAVAYKGVLTQLAQVCGKSEEEVAQVAVAALTYYLSYPGALTITAEEKSKDGTVTREAIEACLLFGKKVGYEFTQNEISLILAALELVPRD